MIHIDSLAIGLFLAINIFINVCYMKFIDYDSYITTG